MTFEEWLPRQQWLEESNRSTWLIKALRLAFDAGQQSGLRVVSERINAMNKRRYQRERKAGICPKCKLKHDAGTVYCDPCKVIIKQRQAAREARKANANKH